MGRLHLMEQEELLLRFRPHPMAYARRYATGLLWILPGLAGLPVAHLLGSRPAASSAFLAAILTLLVALLALRFPMLGFGFAAFATGAFAALGALALLPGLPVESMGALYGVAAALAVTLMRLLLWDWDRRARIHHLTSQRLIVHGGLRSRSERTVQLGGIHETRASRAVLGRVFDYGDLTLVYGRHMRKGVPVEDVEVLSGVAPLATIKHEVDQLLLEQKLPAKERRRRLDERRVKQSMRLLATWMRRQRAHGRT